VVDDDPRIRESVADLLASAGFEARLFPSAEELLDSNALFVSDCLVTDVRMPGMNGWELQRIASSKAPRLPIIFLTAHHDEVGHRTAEELGAFEILYKPFDAEELLGFVDAATNQAGRGSSQEQVRAKG
jgi:FixJ family two-component response regulator